MSTSGINYVYDLVDSEGKIKPFEYWTEFRFVNSTNSLVLTNIILLYWQLIEHEHNNVIVPRKGKHCPEDIDWKSVYKRAYNTL